MSSHLPGRAINDLVAEKGLRYRNTASHRICRAWYHVMNRGAARQAIYLQPSHRQLFLTLLGELLERFGIETHAYCLMDNHRYPALLGRMQEQYVDLTPLRVRAGKER